ncbi:predicted protein [Histoplasma capsulatum G186AR]|uniref:Uncharacterized protein n=1 Tax=Ajellomyces capsulatus (strain G186AR / H82 / ATCC MYA-2454 / RMSCC 2432) TaxID=447093 RepID=C0NYM1_AJECG|nr:uncharacterized protein HCBG_08251 [Histoplasma capsulatum G186AR]EEH03311.1 predicted protein [Histoplasma capsulatum G186AR]
MGRSGSTETSIRVNASYPTNRINDVGSFPAIGRGTQTVWATVWVSIVGDVKHCLAHGKRWEKANKSGPSLPVKKTDRIVAKEIPTLGGLEELDGPRISAGYFGNGWRRDCLVS